MNFLLSVLMMAALNAIMTPADAADTWQRQGNIEWRYDSDGHFVARQAQPSVDGGTVILDKDKITIAGELGHTLTLKAWQLVGENDIGLGNISIPNSCTFTNRNIITCAVPVSFGTGKPTVKDVCEFGGPPIYVDVDPQPFPRPYLLNGAAQGMATLHAVENTLTITLGEGEIKSYAKAK